MFTFSCPLKKGFVGNTVFWRCGTSFSFSKVGMDAFISHSKPPHIITNIVVPDWWDYLITGNVPWAALEPWIEYYLIVSIFLPIQMNSLADGLLLACPYSQSSTSYFSPSYSSLLRYRITCNRRFTQCLPSSNSAKSLQIFNQTHSPDSLQHKPSSVWWRAARI